MFQLIPSMPVPALVIPAVRGCMIPAPSGWDRRIHNNPIGSALWLFGWCGGLKHHAGTKPSIRCSASSNLGEICCSTRGTPALGSDHIYIGLLCLNEQSSGLLHINDRTLAVRIGMSR